MYCVLKDLFLLYIGRLYVCCLVGGLVNILHKKVNVYCIVGGFVNI